MCWDERVDTANVKQISLLKGGNNMGSVTNDSHRYLKSLSGPLMISWDITNKCNMNCRHCLNRSNDKEVHNFDDELGYQDVYNLIKQIIDVRPYTFCICGGEPTLSEYVFTIIEEISKCGTLVNMVSNGYMIDFEYAKKLKNSGLNFIQISVDGINSDTHDSFRNKAGAFERAINAVKFLVENKLHVAVSFCPNKGNIDQFEKYVDMIMKLGCKQIRLMPLLPMGRAYNDYEMIEPSPSDYLEFVRKIVKCKEKYAGNGLLIEWGDPLEHIYLANQIPRPEPISFEIRSNGDIAPSIYLPISVGNIKKHSILEYWKGGFNRIWEHPDVVRLSRKVETIEDFKNLSLRTWNIERTAIDLLEDKNE